MIKHALGLGLSVIAFGCLGERPAFAGSFDARGRFSFDASAVLKESFEAYTAASPSGDAGSDAALSPGLAEKDDRALDGARVLRAQLGATGVSVRMTLPAKVGAYRVAFWLRGDAVSGVAVDYASGAPSQLAYAFPTGRMTSDGWVEMRTAPISVDGAGAGVEARLFLSAYEASQPVSVEIDALEVVTQGEFAQERSCVGLDDDGACAATQLCIAGRCRNAEGWFPPVPAADARVLFASHWKQKIHDTFGPYLPRRESMPRALATMAALPSTLGPVAYWTTFAKGIRQLRDAHTYARVLADEDLAAARSLNACFIEGAADSSRSAAPSDRALPDVLVSHVGPDHAWSLKQGDRLVAVDGAHPLAWARALLDRSLSAWAADDAAQLSNLATNLRTLIAKHARTLSVVRCDAAAQGCAPVVETIDVTAVAPLAAGEVASLVGCDNRPFYHVADAPKDHRFGNPLDGETLVVEGPLLDATADEKLRALLWNDLLGGPGSKLGPKLSGAVSLWKTDARGVVLDHREGHGGTTDMVDTLASFARPKSLAIVGLMRTRANDEGPANDVEGKAIVAKAKGYAGEEFGTSGAPSNVPVALLLTWDVSASDYLPYAMKGAPRVRLFGPGPTMGAFGTFYQYSYWGAFLWSVSAEDSLSPAGAALSGHGVVPDVVVLPKQSDLLAGKDTLHETAMQWLRTEISR